MEVRIGIVNVPREIAFESAQTAAEIEAAVESALSGATALLSLVDDKGRKVIVPAAGIAYVEVGAEKTSRVGFVA